VAGTAGVPPRDAGLASGLLNTSRTVGASIGLAALATIAASRTTSALSGHVSTAERTAAALTDGYTLAFGIAAGILVVTAAVALTTLPSLRTISRASTTTSEPEVLIPQLELDEVLETT
jgi:hypothetical protein